MPQPTRHRSTRKPRQPAPPHGHSGKARRSAAAIERQRSNNSAPSLAALALAGVVLGAATRRRWILVPALAVMLLIIGETIGARRRG